MWNRASSVASDGIYHDLINEVFLLGSECFPKPATCFSLALLRVLHPSLAQLSHQKRGCAGVPCGLFLLGFLLNATLEHRFSWAVCSRSQELRAGIGVLNTALKGFFCWPPSTESQSCPSLSHSLGSWGWPISCHFPSRMPVHEDCFFPIL